MLSFPYTQLGAEAFLNRAKIPTPRWHLDRFLGNLDIHNLSFQFIKQLIENVDEIAAIKDSYYSARGYCSRFNLTDDDAVIIMITAYVLSDDPTSYKLLKQFVQDEPNLHDRISEIQIAPGILKVVFDEYDE